ncbi:MAG: hypothetical protein J0M34_09245 [Alphaproteobacteria bacterium]|nr:hypothetical protein [Alphaproteobacteria bacterium]
MTPIDVQLNDVAGRINSVRFDNLSHTGEMIAFQSSHQLHTVMPPDMLRKYSPEKASSLFKGIRDYSEIPCLSLVIADSEGLPNDPSKVTPYIRENIEAPLGGLLDLMGVDINSAAILCTHVADDLAAENMQGRYILHIMVRPEDHNHLMAIAGRLEQEMLQVKRESRQI